jgi:hypothetical protein
MIFYNSAMLSQKMLLIFFVSSKEFIQSDKKVVVKYIQ